MPCLGSGAFGGSSSDSGSWTTQEKASMNATILALYGSLVLGEVFLRCYLSEHNSPKAPPGGSSASRSPETVDPWIPGT